MFGVASKDPVVRLLRYCALSRLLGAALAVLRMQLARRQAMD
jgi:hypothetical protein